MNVYKFVSSYNEPRNGANHFCRNPLYPKFLYSDGVQECAGAGCYWLLDILCTELPDVFKAHPVYMLIVKVTVNHGAENQCEIVGTVSDYGPPAYTRSVGFTDLPEGVWTFFVFDDSDGVLRCILPTEY